MKKYVREYLPVREFTIRLDEGDDNKLRSIAVALKLSLADTIRQLIRDKKISS